MKYCEHCGNQIENDNAIVCPTCGEPTKSYNQQSDKNIIINSRINNGIFFKVNQCVFTTQNNWVHR